MAKKPIKSWTGKPTQKMGKKREMSAKIKSRERRSTSGKNAKSKIKYKSEEPAKITPLIVSRLSMDSLNGMVLSV